MKEIFQLYKLVVPRVRSSKCPSSLAFVHEEYFADIEGHLLGKRIRLEMFQTKLYFANIQNLIRNFL